MAIIRKYLAAGKPLVGIRTACHAFDTRGKAPPGHVEWTTFDPDVLGGHYTGHYPSDLRPVISLVASADKTHPIVRDVETPFTSVGSLYKTRPLAAGTQALLLGTVPGPPGRAGSLDQRQRLVTQFSIRRWAIPAISRALRFAGCSAMRFSGHLTESRARQPRMPRARPQNPEYYRRGMKRNQRLLLIGKQTRARHELSRSRSFLSEPMIAAVAIALGARFVRGFSILEEALCKNLSAVPPSLVECVRDAIASGEDPLGDQLCLIRPSAERRKQGATLTPMPIVRWMLDWAASYASLERVIDPGTGSGRFAVQAGLRFPTVSILGIESDPLTALIARANLAAAGLAARSEVILGDYRGVTVPRSAGKPSTSGIRRTSDTICLSRRGSNGSPAKRPSRALSASQLAGMHIHFFLATVLKASHGDFGAFITASEWLDVNYGCLLRELFLGDLGGQQIVLIEPTAMPFPDAATTAAITTFEIGSRPESVLLTRVKSLDDIGGANTGSAVRRERMEVNGRWTQLTRSPKIGPAGYVELGELCRVHRGQVTGANKVWIAGPHSEGLPESVLFPSVTKLRSCSMPARPSATSRF